MSQADAIHAGHFPESNWDLGTVPVFQTASFSATTAQELSDIFTGQQPGFAYTRSSNPTTAALERRLTELEGGAGCIVTSSGMAAISSLLLGLLSAGDRVVASAGMFAGTLTLMTKTLACFGVATEFVDIIDTEQVANAVDSQTKLVLVETIGNPKMDVPDLAALSQVTRAAGIPLVVDATVTTPALMKARDWGADLVIHPASTIYHDFAPADKRAAGVTDDLVRVSVGLEEPDDIRNDFEQALARVES